VKGPSRRGRVQVGEMVAFVGGALLLAASWAAVAAGHTVPVAEEQVFEGINGLPDALWPFLRVPMQLGSVAGSLVVAAITWFVTRDRRLALAVVIASQGAFWTARVVKAVVERGRPGELLDGIELRERATGLGYLSGHTAVAFAVAAVLAPSLPRPWRPVVYVAAALVGLARIHGGVHLPLDVVGGIGVGLLWGTLTRWALGLGGEGLPTRRSARPGAGRHRGVSRGTVGR
jgi:glycosyltransferase 2 family protein